ncbi:translation initiation factor IF-2 isoform X1 [Coregonus clupeaformis]|uniref:translation initiation factor IF-2 isoform X1 n=2 Tax=Coregonus clupeaformis TaxID=59861 RepID=UPI001BDFC176|nr:translation initiation factor IF-2 isoform X1 [Coregonus clupeaformis]
MYLKGCLSENNNLIAQTSRQMISDDPFRPRRTTLKRSWITVGPFPRSLWIHPGAPEDDFDRVCAKIWRDSKKAEFGIWPHMEKDSMVPAHKHPPDREGRAEEEPVPPVRPQNIHCEVRANKCPDTRRKHMLIKITDPRLDEISLMVEREFQTLTSQAEKERRDLSGSAQLRVRGDHCSHGDDPIWETQVEKKRKEEEKEEEKVNTEEEQRRSIERYLRDLLIPGQEGREEDRSIMVEQYKSEVEPLNLPNPYLLNPILMIPNLGANLSPQVPNLLPDLSTLLPDLAPNLAPSYDDFPPLPSAASPWQADRLCQGSPPANLPAPLIPIPGPFNLLGKVPASTKASAPAPTPVPVPTPAKVPAARITAPAKVPAMRSTAQATAPSPAPAKVPAARSTVPNKSPTPSPPTPQQELYDLMADFPALQPQGKAPPMGLQQPANAPCRVPTSNVEMLLLDLPYSALFKAQEGDRELGGEEIKKGTKGPKKMEAEPEEEPQDVPIVTDDVDQWPEITTAKQTAFTQDTQQVTAGTDGASAWVGSAKESVRRAAAPPLQKARPLRSHREGPERRQTPPPLVPTAPAAPAAAPSLADIAAAFAVNTAANDLPKESKAAPRQQAPPPNRQGLPPTNQRGSHRYAGSRPQNAHRPGFTRPPQGYDVRTSEMTPRTALEPGCMSGDGHPQKTLPHLYSESFVARVTAVGLGSRCPVNALPGFTQADRGPRRNIF